MNWEITYEDDGRVFPPSREFWTDWKLEFLRRNYHKLTEKRMAERLGYMPETVRKKAVALGLKPWEPQRRSAKVPFGVCAPPSSSHLAYALGAMLGDATITEKDIRFEVRDEEFAMQFGRCMSHVLGRPVVPYVTDDEYFAVRASCSHFLAWLHGSTIVDLWHMLNGYAAEYLAGFFDAEGYVCYSLSGGRRRCSLAISMGMCNTNPMLALLARRFLLDLDIWHTVQRTRWSVRDFPTKNYVSIGKPMYLVSLTKRVSVVRFISLVPIRIARKRKALANLAQEIAARTPFAV